MNKSLGNANFVLISGRANPELAQKTAFLLDIKLADVEFTDFPNQEIKLWIKEDLKEKDVYVIQSFSTPPHDTLVEFLLMVDAALNAGAKKVIGVISWLGYSAQDKIFRLGEPLSSLLVAKLMKTAGVNEAILLDLHSPLNEKHLKEAGIKIKHLSALDVFVQEFKSKQGLEDWAVLCLDKGAKDRSQKFSKELKLPLIELKKQRDFATGEVSFDDFTQNLRGKKLISFDDFVSTGSSRIKAATIVKKLGAKKYIDCITHGLLAGDAVKKIQESEIDEMYLTDSYPIGKEKRISKIKVLSCASILAKAITISSQEV